MLDMLPLETLDIIMESVGEAFVHCSEILTFGSCNHCVRFEFSVKFVGSSIIPSSRGYTNTLF